VVFPCCITLVAAGAALLGASCARRAEAPFIAAVVAGVERDALALSPAATAGGATPPALERWHHFGGATIALPVRVIDSRAAFIYDPAAILAELGGGEKIVICASSPSSFHVYRLAPFSVPWTKICPHDFNYVAQPPLARPPP
jgi:hypothetical protein